MDEGGLVLGLGLVAALGVAALFAFNSYNSDLSEARDRGHAAGAREGRLEGLARGRAAGERSGIDRARTHAAEGKFVQVYWEPLAIGSILGIAVGLAGQAIVIRRLRKTRRFGRIAEFLVPQLRGDPGARELMLLAARQDEARLRIRQAQADADQSARTAIEAASQAAAEATERARATLEADEQRFARVLDEYSRD